VADPPAAPAAVHGVAVLHPGPSRHLGQRRHPAAVPPQRGEGPLRPRCVLAQAQRGAGAGHAGLALRSQSKYLVQHTYPLPVRDVPQVSNMIFVFYFGDTVLVFLLL
jgi:hypothetical protein